MCGVASKSRDGVSFNAQQDFDRPLSTDVRAAPADYDDSGAERFLMVDTRMAVKEAVDAGVHPCCLTPDGGWTEYLPRIFGAGHYLVLDRLEALPQKRPEIHLRPRR